MVFQFHKLAAMFAVAGVLAVTTVGCGGGGAGAGNAEGGSGPGADAGAAGAARTPRAPYKVDALVFDGNGTAHPEAANIARILDERGATYKMVDGPELDAMSVDDIAEYGVIVWPGGLGGTQMSGLATATRVHVRQAVQERGVSYIGFCAGSFVAVGDIAPGKSLPSYGMGIFPGKELTYYYLEDEFVAKGQGDSDIAFLPIKYADGSTRQIIWYGGPKFNEVPGGVTMRYPNGDAAGVQGWAGNGFVSLSAVHPEAPQAWLNSFGLTDPDGKDDAQFWAMFESALKQAPAPVF